MSDDVVSHIKGLISFMESVDEIFKSISSELIKELNQPICCVTDSETMYKLFQLQSRNDILSAIDNLMHDLCKYASESNNRELQSILLKYPYISTYIEELYINPITTGLCVRYPEIDKNKCKDALQEKIRGVAALVLGDKLLDVEGFKECLDIALHPRRFVKVTDKPLHMAVIKLLTAIFNGYCCAIQVNWKEKTNRIEKDMQDVIQSIQTELDKICKGNKKRIRGEDDVIVEINNIIKKFDCDVITTAQRTAFKRPREEGEVVNKAIGYLSKRRKRFYSKNIKVFELEGQKWIAIPNSNLNHATQHFVNSIHSLSESDHENSIDDLLDDSS